MNKRALSFTLAGAPRTKKTSQRVITIKAEGGGRGFTKILPSEAFEAWLDCVLLQGGQIRYQLQRAGHTLPIETPVAVRALIFRQTDTGDTNGFQQAIADALHAPQYRFKCTCGARGQNEYELKPVACRSCGSVIRIGQPARKGLAIIRDDSQIKSWDGTRLYVDSSNPRVQIEIIEFTEVAQQESLALAGVAC